MSYWKNQTVELGVIKHGSPKKITFNALSTIPEIERIEPFCGCTSPKYDKDKKVLTVVYSNGSIPSQVQGLQSIIKKIQIFYKNGKSEILTIKAIKTR